ncbi:MAG: phosphoribosylamine--glycine ligase [Treponema sp.]|nr:phosphoribosylamine--glycine ligase [Treponema sp.]
MEKVLIVGRGGREHALARQFAHSPSVGRVFVAPGSPGMRDVAVPLGLAEDDFAGLETFARQEAVGLTVIGPEGPLVAGLADRFLAAGLPVFAPTAAAAAIEGSKSFAKGLIDRAGIPTAAYRVFTEHAAALEHVRRGSFPTVIKADGLAAGKGVVVAADLAEAEAALDEMLRRDRFGPSGRTVIVEEFLEGREFSLIALVAGETVLPLPPARDHKRAFDGDLGPNTGGMGAYSPVPDLDDRTLDLAVEGILKKTARAMVAEGIGFTGFLYAGLIATKEGPKVIEFNARLGDPEAQVLLPRLEGDLFATVKALVGGAGDKIPPLSCSPDAVAGVVLASRGYPGDYETGFPVEGLADLDRETLSFHCGTDLKDGGFVTAGGRVLVLARKAASLSLARQEVYREIEKVRCGNLFYRKDIGANLG